MDEVKLPQIKTPTNPLTPEGMRALLIVIAVIILLGGIGLVGIKSRELRKGTVGWPTPTPTVVASPTFEEATVSPIASPTAVTLTPEATVSAQLVEVRIASFAYQPASVSTGRGSTIVWTNSDTVAHTVTADDGSFDSGSIAPGDSFEQRFDKRKSYSYTCVFHPQMKGTITIE